MISWFVIGFDANQIIKDCTQIFKVIFLLASTCTIFLISHLNPLNFLVRNKLDVFYINKRLICSKDLKFKPLTKYGALKILKVKYS